MKQNITLALDKDIIQRLRMVAARRMTSVSNLLREELVALVDRAEKYDQAKAKALAFLDQGFHLGGKPAARDDLYDR